MSEVPGVNGKRPGKKEMKKCEKNQDLVGDDAGFGSYPSQARTGSMGYFGKRGSVKESVQWMKTLPRALVIVSPNRHFAQRPDSESIWS